jgi:hypothetical protein
MPVGINCCSGIKKNINIISYFRGTLSLRIIMLCFRNNIVQRRSVISIKKKKNETKEQKERKRERSLHLLCMSIIHWKLL